MTLVTCGAILSDLDGTLIDSTEATAQAWTRFCEQRGLDPQPFLQIAFGTRTAEVLQKLAPAEDIPKVAAELEQFVLDYGSDPVPGAVELLNALPGSSWSVVTSAMRATAMHRFTTTDLPEPQVLVTAEDIPVGKPHPECYLIAAERLGRSPDDCIVLEDAPAGVQAAHNAGMRCIALLTSHAAEQLPEATYYVHDLRAVRLRRATEAATGAWTLDLDVDAIS